jgi:glycine C-acetyltransferase
VYGTTKDELAATLAEIEAAGLYKHERQLASPQSAHITTSSGEGQAQALNFCANNYLGLADNPEVEEAAAQALRQWGFGMASVRFICGTQVLHKQLEAAISGFLGTDDTILYSSCFDANGGVFEVLLGEQDAVVSDELNHASLIDGIRLCKAKRYRYRNADMDDLRSQLQAARDAGAHRVLVVTDGVFSMEGNLAPLDAICDLAD